MAQQLSRADEDTLKRLRLKADAGTLTEEEDLVRSMLEDRYNVFLEEGLKKLRRQDGTGSGVSDFFKGLLSGGNKEPPRPRNASFSNRSLDTADDAVTSSQGVIPHDRSPTEAGPDGDEPYTPQYPGLNHWNWISSDLIVGAVPNAAAHAPEKAAHLRGLRDQLHHERAHLALVVSCMEVDELAASSLTTDFAAPRDWEQELQVNCFLTFPLPADPACTIDVPFSETLQVCSQVHTTLHPTDGSDGTLHGRTPVAFIHCKAGRGRAWVVAMCYLTSQMLLSMVDAEELIKKYRPHVAPSTSQINYVKDFVQFCATPIAQKRSDEEENYKMVLASILSLAPNYRARLLQDLQRFT